ncbi:MAG: DNA polymerase III subunit chi [Pseudomonadota bacterium]|nr:DNA polymerase III subunit chi [Pseudomonadota bacterium]
MTEIDFYTHAQDRLRVACQLIQKARSRDLQVLVLLADEGQLRALDERLWTWHPHAFLPHCRAGEAHAAQTPVLLACEEVEPPHDQLLLNLQPATPRHFERYARLLEVVSQDEQDRVQARERFRFYRERGFTLRSHTLGQGSDGGTA